MSAKYRVWAQAVGRFGHYEECIVEVEDGEDPEEICQDACNDLISNLVESGWEKVE
jgi:hypothetical protein